MSDLLSDRRILVIEDEMLILFMIEGMLLDLGCQSVTGAGTITGAVSLIGSEAFDAALLDMNLGGEDSGAVATALVEKGIPFIYCTGNSRRNLKHGFQDQMMLHKPFLETDLNAALTQLLS